MIKQLDDDTVAYDITLGVNEYFCEITRVALKVETAQYAKGIAWLRDLLYGAVYDPERYVRTSLCFHLFHFVSCFCFDADQHSIVLFDYWI